MNWNRKQSHGRAKSKGEEWALVLSLCPALTHSLQLLCMLFLLNQWLYREPGRIAQHQGFPLLSSPCHCNQLEPPTDSFVDKWFGKIRETLPISLLQVSWTVVQFTTWLIFTLIFVVGGKGIFFFIVIRCNLWILPYTKLKELLLVQQARERGSR